MSLFIRVNCNFFTHRKTARLRALIGDDGLWLVPRWWAYAAENQPDGNFSDYTAAELANLLQYAGDPVKMLEALLQAGFADNDPLRIHDWSDYNGFHQAFAMRARKAAAARWEKERTKENGEDKRREEKSQAMLGAYGHLKPSGLLGTPILSAVERISKEKSLERLRERIKKTMGSATLTELHPEILKTVRTMRNDEKTLLKELGLNY